jgi:MoxR-like ATPase
VQDRMSRLAVGYQDEAAEIDIVRLRAAVREPLRDRIIIDAVAVTRDTRLHEDIRQGSSVRGAIDTAMIAVQLAVLRGIAESPDDRYADMFF